MTDIEIPEGMFGVLGAVFAGMNHIQIANHPEIYDALRDLLACTPG